VGVLFPLPNNLQLNIPALNVENPAAKNIYTSMSMATILLLQEIPNYIVNNVIKQNKMETQLNSNEKIRVSAHNYLNKANFIDITALDAEIGLRITNYSNTYQYFEVRKKDNQVAMFFFAKKSDKKYTDFKYWKDAEVVYSLNDTDPRK
jgi:hypothetical protein